MATELQILAGGGIAAPVREIAARFEARSGTRTVIRFGTTPELVRLATTSAFDLGVVPQDVLDHAAARRRFAPSPPVAIARAGIAIAVKKDADRPNIATPDALRRALLGARAIASIPASATGTQLAAIYAELGISAEMEGKVRALSGPAQIADAVAAGDCDLGVFLINVLADPRLDIVGPLPAEIQREVVFVTGLAADPPQQTVARSFMELLRSPEATDIIRSKGMTPG